MTPSAPMSETPLNSLSLATTFLQPLWRTQVAAFLGRQDGQQTAIVVDPVMVSTSGSRLIDAAAQATLRDVIFPFADIITPNLLEAQALVEPAKGDGGSSLDSPEAVQRAAEELLATGPRAVLIKGNSPRLLLFSHGIWRGGMACMFRHLRPRVLPPRIRIRVAFLSCMACTIA